MGGVDAYTVLMLHMNSDFTDSSYAGVNSPHTITGMPTLTPPTIDTTLGSYPLTGETGAGKFQSLLSQYLSIPDSADWNFGTGNFTIDFWIRFNTLPPVGYQNAYFYSQYDTDSGDTFFFKIQSESGATYRYMVYLTTGGSNKITDTFDTTVATGTWYHIALVRSGNSWIVFQGGTQVGTTKTHTDSITDLPAPMTMSYGSGGGYLDGWLDEFRISKGVARWTSNFTPPTRAYGPFCSKYLGVANASIGKVNGVPYASIKKINGCY